jgi:4-amino-4-deoxy-L-arabinose transferase-like glycosyltransferase
MMSVSRDFWDSFFVYSNVNRVITPLEGHGESYLYYFQHLLTNETVWAVILPFAVAFCIYNIATKRSKADILLIGWMTIVLGLFTFAQTKLFWYILPAMPAFALAIGSLLYQTGRYVRLKINKQPN